MERRQRLLVDGTRSQANGVSADRRFSDASEIVEFTGERVPATGNVGRVTVMADEIELREGGLISTATLAAGRCRVGDGDGLRRSSLVDGGVHQHHSATAGGEAGSVTSRGGPHTVPEHGRVDDRAFDASAERRARSSSLLVGELIDLHRQRKSQPRSRGGDDPTAAATS